MKLKYPALLALLLSAPSVFAQVPSVVINEVDADTPGDDAAEFIELYDGGVGSTPLDGLAVVFFNGSDDKSYLSFDLDGNSTNADGYFVLGNPAVANVDMTFSPGRTGALQNGADAVALIVGNAEDFPNDTPIKVEGLLNSLIAGNLVDAIVYDTSDGDDAGLLPLLNSGQPQVNEKGNGASDTESNQRCANGSGGLLNTSSYAQYSPTPGTENTCGVDDGGDDDAPSLGVISGSVCTNCPDVPIIKDISLFDAAVYYAAVDLSATAEIIKAAVNNIISTDHKNLTYDDVWTSLTYTDEDPSDTNNITLWYDGRSQAKSTNGSGAASSNPDNWNREHSWPKSHGFSSDSLEAYTDIHHLRPTDISINSSRGNLDFDNSDSPLTESPINRVDGDSFEPRADIKGDVARMMFYMDTRYEGSGSDVTPDLELVNRVTTTSESKLGWLCTLAAWNAADPVDASEQLRNDRIYELQGNRNPFIDNEAWVELLYPVADCNVDGGGGDDGGGDDGGGDDGGDTGSTSTLVFINEFHYDNTGGDTGEAIEIAGLAGTDLSGLSLVLYNGSNGTTYNTIALSGVLANQQNGFGTTTFDLPSNGLQNGSPDGIALVDADDNVLQFLSYEGALVATNGPANGMTSEDVGVSEPSSTPIGNSLQLAGTGSSYEDFVWVAAAQNTFSDVNNEQSFVAPVPFINEFHYDNTGGDTGEAIEVAGVAGLDLSVFSLVLYNGSNGTTYNTIALSGVLPNQQNGFGITSFDLPTNGLQNGSPDGIALVDAEGNVIQFLSYEGTLEATNGPALGMTSEDVGVSEPSSTPVGHSLQLAGDGVKYSDFTWEAAAANTFDAVNTNQTFAGGGDGEEPGECCDEITLIHAVQGSGDASPLDGDTVKIEGVVSATFANISGFFVQEEDADADADPSTSEGIFVFYDGELPAVGDLVSVIGDVSEFFTRTQIATTEMPEVISTGNTLPTASALTLPFVSVETAESMEGMLITTSQELTVSDNFRLGRFGEVALSNGRLYIPTNVFTPGSSEAQALATANSLNVVYMGDADPAQNPDPVIYPTGNLSASNTLRSGDTVSSVTGVLDYDFGKYLINPTVAPNFAATNPRTNVPDLVLGNLKIASLNVLNFFNGDGQGGGFPTSRGADSIEEYERQLAKTVEAIVIMDADIVGLMEIENDGFDSLSAIAQLTAAINVAMGEEAYSYVNAGAPVGSDAITVGFLYKGSVVGLSDVVDILDSDNSISDENGPLFNTLKNRPAMSQKFALVENGQEIVISVNHLKSKGSGCGAGDDDTTDGQGNCNGTRTRAATALVAHLAQNFTDLPTLIIGDLNSYAKEQPITTITAAGYTNLVEQFQGAEAYSYTFRGELGYLDHALGNNQLLDKVVDVTEWHINADEPIVLDYNVEFQTEAQQTNLYAPDQYRMSDHDPVLIALQLNAEVMTGDWDLDGDVDINDVRGLIGAIQRREAIDLAFDFNNDGVVNTLDARLMMTLCTRTRCAA